MLTYPVCCDSGLSFNQSHGGYIIKKKEEEEEEEEGGREVL